MRILKTGEDYQRTLSRLDEISDAPINSKEGDEAELLILLIENYENEHYPIGPPDPIEAIKFRMEQMGDKEERPGRGDRLQKQGIRNLKQEAETYLNYDP